MPFQTTSPDTIPSQCSPVQNSNKDGRPISLWKNKYRFLKGKEGLSSNHTELIITIRSMHVEVLTSE